MSDPGELSGGMRTRVGLDPLASRNVDEMILDACARYTVTSVVISHDMASVFRSADRIAIAEGRAS